MAKRFRAGEFKGMDKRTMEVHLGDKKNRARVNSIKKYGSTGALNRQGIAQNIKNARMSLRSGSAPKSLKALDRKNLHRTIKGAGGRPAGVSRKLVRKVATITRRLKGTGGQRRDSKGRFA